MATDEQQPPTRLELTSPDEAANITAQYIRLSLFVLVVLLGVSIVFASLRDDGVWEGSISDYFHTPARLVLVATLVAIGVLMMALFPPDRQENRLLNIAGAICPIVGLAATTQEPPPDDPLAYEPVEFDVSSQDIDAFATNSLTAYFAALALLVFFVYRVHPPKRRTANFARTAVGLAILAIVTWITWETDRRKVHSLAAFGFFGPLVVLVFYKASRSDRLPSYKRSYAAIGSLMFLAGVLYAVDRCTLRWDHATFVVEVALIACFAVFWLMEYLHIAPLARELYPTTGQARPRASTDNPNRPANGAS